jgi:hypothetical protein
MIELLLGVDFELGSDIYDWVPLVTQGGRASVVATRCQTVRATPAPTPRVPRWDRLLRSLSDSTLCRRYPASCALQVGNGVLPRLRLGGFLARSLRRPPVEDGRLELLLH